MIFASDNWAGASDRVVAAIAEASRGSTPAYGGDELTAALERRFSELFEHDVGVLTVGTGTAANALGIAAYCRPGSVVFAHAQAHILVDEANAVAFAGDGAKVAGVDGAGGKLTPATLEAAMALYPAGAIRHGQPVAVSVSQISELGLAYSAEEIDALTSVAQSGGLGFHMDGARFAGAVAGLGVPPAELTWKSGVDVLSFGGTKNGCVAAEALIFFDPDRATDTAFARLRMGHGFSKQWFVAAQLLAYLEDDHWLDLANHANAMAGRLAAALRGCDEARLALEPAANEVFVVMSNALDERLKAAGAVYYPWSGDGMPVEALAGEGEVLVRLVTSFRTSAAEVEAFAAVLSAG